jgi:chromate transporter
MPLAAIFLRSLRGSAGAFMRPGRIKAPPAFLDALPCGSGAQAAGLEGLEERGWAGLLAGYAGYCLPGFVLMAGLGAVYPSLAGLPALAGVWAGLRAVVPALCLAAGVAMLAPRRGKPILLALAACASMLFFLGLKPFSMLLGGAVIGVLMLEDPKGLPAPPQSTPYPWKLPALLFLGYAGLAAVFFLADTSLGRLYLLAGKAELWSLGGFGGLPLLFADTVRLRHWLDQAAFADLAALSALVPGPVMAASSFVGSLSMGMAGALAALTGFFAVSCGVLLAALPARDLIASCAWARKALDGVAAALGGMALGFAARLAADMPWDVPRAGLACLAALALLARVHPALAVLAAAAGGFLLF